MFAWLRRLQEARRTKKLRRMVVRVLARTYALEFDFERDASRYFEAGDQEGELRALIAIEFACRLDEPMDRLSLLNLEIRVKRNLEYAASHGFDELLIHHRGLAKAVASYRLLELRRLEQCRQRNPHSFEASKLTVLQAAEGPVADQDLDELREGAEEIEECERELQAEKDKNDAEWDAEAHLADLKKRRRGLEAELAELTEYAKQREDMLDDIQVRGDMIQDLLSGKDPYAYTDGS